MVWVFIRVALFTIAFFIGLVFSGPGGSSTKRGVGECSTTRQERVNTETQRRRGAKVRRSNFINLHLV
jgi:hypothetical protein